jgi:hypothetical protein
MLLTAITMMLAATGPVDPKTGVPEWETVDRHCVYSKDREGSTYQGPCKEYNNYKTGEHSILFQTRKFTITEYEPMRHELPWLFVKINGHEAVGFERHRSWMSYTTMDFLHVLDVCGEADEFGGCK